MGWARRKGMEGKPAPAPTSRKFPLSCTIFDKKRESRISLISTFSESLREIRLMVRFHRRTSFPKRKSSLAVFLLSSGKVSDR
jgi:hypothetical protein